LPTTIGGKNKTMNVAEKFLLSLFGLFIFYYLAQNYWFSLTSTVAVIFFCISLVFAFRTGLQVLAEVTGLF
jgi:uncharacterized protein (DUF58 family)